MTPRPFFALVVFALLSPTVSTAQSPWEVTVSLGLNPLPIPFCNSVRVDIIDPKTGQRPRNAGGALMGSADFDLTVTSADPRAMVGQPGDPNNFMVCACLAGKAGTVGTITATYPANRVPAKSRVPGVAFQTTTTFTLAAAKGSVDSPACAAPRPATIAAGSKTPLPEAPSGRIAPGVPPTGVTVSGPPLTATVTWTAAPNAVRYAVLRKDDAQPAVERSPAGLTATTFTETLPDPRITYQYFVLAYYADGTMGQAAPVQYVHQPMVNPTGFTITKTGQTSTKAMVDFRWNPVPGAVQYRLDGPGIGAGHYTPGTYFPTSVPRGAGSWTVAAVYPGNYGDYVKATSVSAVLRVLPTASVPWLTKSNGPGSEENVQLPVIGCSPEEDPCRPSKLRHPYDPSLATFLGKRTGTNVRSGWGLNIWLWGNDPWNGLWDDDTQYPLEARYGNPGDLGVGRRSDCRQNEDGGPQGIGMYTVCYAAAHGIPPGQPGFNNPQVINSPGEGQGNDFILAMVITKSWQGSVFMVFGAGGDYKLSPTVELDTQGPKFVPYVCLSCHGGIYDGTSRYVKGASFLPIDPNLQSFASETEKESQQDRIRHMNSLIAKSGSSPAVTAYINGLYGNAVHQEGTRAIVNYVPAGWQSQAGLYRQVVGPYCAMCHLAATTDLSFSSWANFESNAVRIKYAVCSAHTMPHAEIQFTEFWMKDTGPVYLPGLLTSSLNRPGC